MVREKRRPVHHGGRGIMGGLPVGLVDHLDADHLGRGQPKVERRSIMAWRTLGEGFGRSKSIPDSQLIMMYLEMWKETPCSPVPCSQLCVCAQSEYIMQGYDGWKFPLS